MLPVVVVIAAVWLALGSAHIEAFKKPLSAIRSARQLVAVGAAQPAPSGPSAVVAGSLPGTCLAYAPLKGDLGRTIFLDPGHGGLDPGTSGETSAGVSIQEKDLTLPTAFQLLARLRADGYRVVMSRVRDTLLIQPSAGEISAGALTAAADHRDAVARIDCANASHADLLISIHYNSYDDSAVNGAETLYDSARSFAAANLRLATLAQGEVVSALRAAGWAVPDRGILDDGVAGTPALTAEGEAYGHLLELGPAAPGWLDRPSTMPGILIEPLFLSHPAEADVAVGVEGQQTIAHGLERTVLDYFGSRRPG